MKLPLSSIYLEESNKTTLNKEENKLKNYEQTKSILYEYLMLQTKF